eukprot:TRINITY_DN1927_c0_g1_i1.p1 TRINITY_DN1927_c0_g1~~TRINITY_DN1927_c0_g1_i1.p1  ORF type:complete len:283 (+),score=81.10 TRINITY_DN1927_c0_g1_i1:97-945(+)
MSSKTITSFFKAKRKEGATDSKDGEPDAKRSPVDAQKQAILEKKLQAGLKLAKSEGIPVVASIAPSWAQALHKEFEKPYFKQLMAFLKAQKAAGKTIFPPAEDVHSYSRACNINDVKVVILGQDPYHGPNQAHGLCFSVRKGVAIPPSLRNIYNELAEDIDGFVKPTHGYLQSWAEQGVLLLNAVLTVERSKANSHKNQGWETWTDAIIEYINRRFDNVVFILWGNYAKKKGKKVDKTRHLVLDGGHPSPLSVARFKGCRHFSRANEYLVKKGKTPINWGLL